MNLLPTDIAGKQWDLNSKFTALSQQNTQIGNWTKFLELTPSRKILLLQIC
jgi:hypothetical protein